VDGVFPAACQLAVAPPQPRPAPPAGIRQRLDLPNRTLVQRVERKDGSDLIGTGHTMIVIVRHGGETSQEAWFCRARPPWRAANRKFGRTRRNATKGVPYRSQNPPRH